MKMEIRKYMKLNAMENVTHETLAGPQETQGSKCRRRKERREMMELALLPKGKHKILLLLLKQLHIRGTNSQKRASEKTSISNGLKAEIFKVRNGKKYS